MPKKSHKKANFGFPALHVDIVINLGSKDVDVMYVLDRINNMKEDLMKGCDVESCVVSLPSIEFDLIRD